MKSYVKILLFTLHFSLFAFPLFAQSNDWLSARYGTGQRTIGNSVIIDNNGDCFVTGLYSESDLVFEAYTLQDSLPYLWYTFLVKYDRNGNIQWAKQSHGDDWGAASNGCVSSTDKANNIYMTASFEDTVIFGSYLLKTAVSYSFNSFLVKFDPNGNVLWAKQSTVPPGDTSYVASNYVITDKNGNSYIAGFFDKIAIFDRDTLFYGDYGNTFLVKYDANGNVKWAKQSKTVSAVSNAEIFGESLDPYGNIYVVGRFEDTVSFETHTLKCPYYTDNFFLVKYDSNGNVKWARQAKILTPFCFGWGFATTCDKQGNVYVAGEFEDTLIFDKDTLISSCDTIFNHDLNHTNFFVAKYDSAGNFKWAVQDNTPTAYGSSAWGISSDTMGHIYVCGGVGSKNPVVTFENDTLKTTDTATVDDPTILLKLDTAGNLLCGNIFPYGSIYPSSIASDPTGNYVYYAGTLGTEAIFGKDTIDAESKAFPILARWEECEPILGVNNIVANSSNAEAKVYPNPNNGKFTLEIKNEESGINNKVEIYNVLGVKVYSQLIIKNSQMIINLSGQPNGVYLYRVITENGELVGQGKLVIQR